MEEFDKYALSYSYMKYVTETYVNERKNKYECDTSMFR